jgi:hypothetical protein
MSITKKDYVTAANIVAEIKDPLKQATVYRGFCDLFQTQPNFNPNKFETACKIIDPIAGLRPKRLTKPPTNTCPYCGHRHSSKNPPCESSKRPAKNG